MMKVKTQISKDLVRYQGILYEISEENYDDTKHQGFEEGKEIPISMEGEFIGRYTRHLFKPERDYLVMMPDENPPTLMYKGWAAKAIYLGRGHITYVGANHRMLVVLDSDEMVYDLIVHDNDQYE